jgi:hypothetical protein
LRSNGAEAVHLRREATSNDFTLYTGSVERLRVFASNGYLGLGTTNPLFRLDVSGGARATSFTAGTSTNAPSGYPFYASSDAAGVSAAVQLRSNYAGYSTSFIGNVGTYGTYISHNREVQVGGFVDAAASPNQSNAAYAVVGDTQRTRIFQVGNFLMSGSTPVEMPRMVVKYNGNVGIGSTPAAVDPAERLVVDGNIHVTGSINAKYQDVAEWVPSSNDLAPGTVVVLDPAIGNGVMASGAAYDTSVAGVVSAQPGLILGEAGANKEQIATTGRVRVRVDATAAPIRVGDLLVTSGLPGVAMKSSRWRSGDAASTSPARSSARRSSRWTAARARSSCCSAFSKTGTEARYTCLLCGSPPVPGRRCSPSFSRSRLRHCGPPRHSTRIPPADSPARPTSWESSTTSICSTAT